MAVLQERNLVSGTTGGAEGLTGTLRLRIILIRETKRLASDPDPQLKQSLLETLSFRRQFLVTRQPVSALANWQISEVAHYYLHVHPDLNLTVAENSRVTLVLLGYWFDPKTPTATDKEILDQIADRAGCFEDVVLALKQLTGRYVLLYCANHRVNVVSDALGLREVYYTTIPNLVVCGSQPHLLAKFSQPRIEPSRDPNLTDFLHSDWPRVRDGRLWPGDGTTFEGVKHLLPNHFFESSTLSTRRYWPNVPFATLTLEDCVAKAAAFLRGAMKAAAHRKSLMLAVTAGLDSRSILAACRDITDRVYFFINKHPSLSARHSDIRVPVQMFKQLGLPFHVHDTTGDIPQDFKRLFFENTFLARERLLPAIYNVYFRRHGERLNVIGVGEVGRTKFGDEPRKLTPHYLAYTLHYRRSRYAVQQCGAWLNESKPAARKFGLNLMTLFWWEVLIGNWGVVGNSESDIAIEEFDPYASHGIYELLLAVSPKYRTFHDNVLFDELIRVMWPELLSFPVNPPDGLKDWGIHALRKLGIEEALRSAKYRTWELAVGRSLAPEACL